MAESAVGITEKQLDELEADAKGVLDALVDDIPPVVVELAGSPKSGKLTTIEIVSPRAFQVLVVALMLGVAGCGGGNSSSEADIAHARQMIFGDLASGEVSRAPGGTGAYIDVVKQSTISKDAKAFELEKTMSDWQAGVASVSTGFLQRSSS